MVVDRAMPTANAPTMGDRPIEPASAAAPKNAAVTIPSMLPLACHRDVCMRRGMRNTDATSMAPKKPRTCSMVNVTSIMSTLAAPPSEPASDVTTERTAMASMSSTTAAPMISAPRASLSCRTR